MEELIKDITKMVWNKFIATPKNEHRDMQFSYQNLKHEVGTIVIDYAYAHKNEFNIANVSNTLLCPFCGGELYDSILHNVPTCKDCGAQQSNDC